MSVSIDMAKLQEAIKEAEWDAKVAQERLERLEDFKSLIDTEDYEAVKRHWYYADFLADNDSEGTE